MNTRCVIGIGCDDHGDQIAGLLVARRIAAAAPAGVTVIESGGAPDDLIAAWADAEDVTVVEAMPGDAPGDTARCQPHPRPLTSTCSPTRLSPELREALGRGPLPTRLTVITIAAQRFTASAGVSPEVAAAARRVASGLLEELTGDVAQATPAALVGA